MLRKALKVYSKQNNPNMILPKSFVNKASAKKNAVIEKKGRIENMIICGQKKWGQSLIK